MSDPITKNLEKMIGNDCPMRKLLHFESIGGNADSHNGINCSAANFLYNSNTGEINEFTNYINLSNDKYWGSFKILCSMKHPRTIVNTFHNSNPSRFVRAVISKTVFLYNAKEQQRFDETGFS